MVFGNFFRNNKQTFGKALVSGLKFGQILKKTYNDWSSGQYHIPSYNYCGSGTKLNGQEATNNTDEACKKHDYSYDNIKNNRDNLDNNNIKQMVRKADIDLINNVKNENNIGSFLVRNGMRLKNFAEDHGIIKHDLFI